MITSPRRPAPGVVLLCAVVIAAAAFAAGLVLAPSARPASLNPATSTRSVPTSHTQFDDVRQVTATPVITPGASLTSVESGRLTASACQAGADLVSGSAPFTVDDRPVVALASSRPLWRDLVPGTSGDDVRGLQEELTRLGSEVSVTGVYDEQTIAAVVALRTSVGAAAPSRSLEVSSVLWLPAPAVTVDSCAVPLGGLVSPGATLATTTGTLTALTLDRPPTGLTPGERAVTYADVTVQLPDAASAGATTVTDPVLLTAVAAGAEYAAWLQSEGATPFAVGYRLSSPVEVLVVPPGALFGLNGDVGCLRSGTVDFPVTIVASTLGQTLVRVDASPSPDRVDLVDTVAPKSCG